MNVTEARIWAELEGAVRDRGHGWRLPVLATLASDGAPDARTVVLREVDAGAGRLTFFTDARSPKTAQLAADARVTLVFWCPRLGWQLRVAATVAAIKSGERIHALVARLEGSNAAADYRSPAPPGSRLSHATNTEGGLHPCILDAFVVSMDWLALSPDGNHARVRFKGDRAEPLVP